MNQAVRDSQFRAQRKWLENKLQDIQENLEYCSVSIRIENGNITIYKKEQTELVPKTK